MSRFQIFWTSVAAILMGVGLMSLGGLGDALHIHTKAGLSPAVTVDLSAYAPCSQEDGSGYDQVYPCVWDAALRGNGQYSGDRWHVYGDFTECPYPPLVSVRCEVLD